MNLTEWHLPAHSHPFRTDPVGDHYHDVMDGVMGFWELPSGNQGLIVWGYALTYSEYTSATLENTGYAGEHTHTAQTVGAGSGTPIENRPAYRQLPFIISDLDNPRTFPIPAGAITIWTTDIARIPQGWQLCDGTNGTPDLRDRFALAGGSPGGSGGSNQIQISPDNMAPHTHTLTTAIDGGHTHEIFDDWRGYDHYWQYWPSNSTGCGVLPYVEHPKVTDVYSVLTDCIHHHTGATDPVGGGIPYDNRPAYYKAAFIMRMP